MGLVGQKTCLHKVESAGHNNSEEQPIVLNNTIVLTNNQRIPFIARLVNPGDKFGQHLNLSVSEAQVHIFDSRYNFNPQLGFVGQFVSAYYVATLLQDEDYPNGLQLDGGTEEWQLSKDNMTTLIEWLKEETCQK